MTEDGRPKGVGRLIYIVGPDPRSFVRLTHPPHDSVEIYLSKSSASCEILFSHLGKWRYIRSCVSGSGPRSGRER